MTSGLYVLEVIKIIIESDGKKESKLEHIGYMKAKFKTKADACSYYDRNNPHLRKINIFGTFESDWDPITNLLYIVRDDYGLVDNIPTFSLNDMPVNNIYKYLK
jgi:hypothetical protein